MRWLLGRGHWPTLVRRRRLRTEAPNRTRKAPTPASGTRPEDPVKARACDELSLPEVDESVAGTPLGEPVFEADPAGAVVAVVDVGLVDVPTAVVVAAKVSS